MKSSYRAECRDGKANIALKTKALSVFGSLASCNGSRYSRCSGQIIPRLIGHGLSPLSRYSRNGPRRQGCASPRPDGRALDGCGPFPNNAFWDEGKDLDWNDRAESDTGGGEYRDPLHLLLGSKKRIKNLSQGIRIYPAAGYSSPPLWKDCPLSAIKRPAPPCKTRDGDDWR